MYKVFFKDNTITISSKRPENMNGVNFQQIENDQVQNVLPLIKDFLINSENSLLIVSKTPDVIWNTFIQGFKIIKAAGGAVLNDKKLLVIKRLGKWDLPKGKIENDEMPEQAAVREVNEETGISQLKIVQKLPDTWHIYKSPYPEDNNCWILKKTYWYQMDYSGNEKLVPQTSEDIDEVRWIPINHLKKVKENTYASLMQIFAFYG